jgi:hypothetical protein
VAEEVKGPESSPTNQLREHEHNTNRFIVLDRVHERLDQRRFLVVQDLLRRSSETHVREGRASSTISLPAS